MQHIKSSDFIQDVLTQYRPAVVVFHNSAQTVDNLGFIEVLKKYKESAPNMPVFLYNVEEEKNVALAEHLGVENTPTLMVFKNGSLNRWLEPNKLGELTVPNVVKFLGNPVLYGVEKETAAELIKSLSVKKAKKEKAPKVEKDVKVKRTKKVKP